MKSLLVLTALFWSINAFSNVECAGVPSAVFVGVHGPAPSEDTFFVSLPNKGAMPLGSVNDDKAKSRFSMALSAFHAKKTIILNYYHHTSCSEASSERAAPTRSVIID